MSLTKNPHTPTKKFFFECKLEDLSLLLSLLPGLLRWAEKFPHKATCISVFFSRKFPKMARHQSVNFKNEFHGSKNSEILVFNCKNPSRWRFLAKNRIWEMKNWLCLPPKIHLVEKISKCCISATSKIFQKIFCHHHNFSISITYVRISKIHD